MKDYFDVVLLFSFSVSVNCASRSIDSIALQVGNVDIPAHRCILSAQNPVLKARLIAASLVRKRLFLIVQLSCTEASSNLRRITARGPMQSGRTAVRSAVSEGPPHGPVRRGLQGEEEGDGY